MERTIFLVDMNAFFITCETRRNPELKGRPAAVAGDPNRRSGIILAANYEARVLGIKTTMTVNEALKRSPELLLVPPDHHYYEVMSDAVMNYLSRFSPVVEQNSIDEAWIDMTGTEHLFGRPMEAAELIMEGLKKELQLWCSIGISSNKFLAKMASEMKKPLGITTLRKEEVAEKLWPLPVQYMYGIGAKTTEALNKLNIITIRDVALYDKNKLIRIFGKAGISMHEHANGIDDAPLNNHSRDDVKSVGKSVTLSKDISNIQDAKLILMKLADEVSIRARSKSKKGQTVQISLKYADFKTITRQRSIARTNLSKALYHAGAELLDDIWSEKKPIRLIGIALTNFDDAEAGEQISLFDLKSQNQNHTKDQQVQEALDEIRKKFGNDKVSWASLIDTKKST
ncbi:DNA polymerase IV [Proteiniclasticum sp. C24MP]|uniref:DNA polymerase IV n=1 Tax=Proteiniclasticum sp. C24MP TaxID=3374101 RepID=UPI003754A33D